MSKQSISSPHKSQLPVRQLAKASEASSLAHGLYDLFRGRTDAYGGDDGRAIWKPVTVELVQGHLDGTEAIGIYPIEQRANDDDRMLVRWGCCDIDTGEWREAYMLCVALQGMGATPYVERSRSKGWHVWVFAEDWVEAWEMRRMLKVAYKAIDLAAKEANPKSESLRASQLGNYVRLPYKGWTPDSTRQVMMKNWSVTSDGVPMEPREFFDTVVKTPTGTIRKWAAKWYEPPRVTVVSTETLLEDADLKVLADRMDCHTYKLWAEGPKKADRSETLLALAFALRNKLFTPQECYQLVHAADRMWGKYHLRPDGDNYIADIVERAYK